MAMNGHEQNEADEQQIPARLAEELKTFYAPQQVVPRRVDDAVLAVAREHLAGIAQSRGIVRFPRWLAAAAVVALAAVLGSLLFSNRRLPDVAREDVNRDGRVDVLDAFALARRLQQGAAMDRLFDINGDGVVDQKDIDAIATRAVRLDGRQG
jgi:hypothetical protein